MSPRAVALAANVYRIPTMPLDLVNTFAFVDDDGSVTLVDCGLPGSLPRIVAGLAAFGKAPQDVRRVVLTHAHGDHAGGARAVLDRCGTDGVLVHRDDACSTREGTGPPRDPGRWLGRLLTRRESGRRSFAPVGVRHELVDGEVLPVGGGLRVVHTPGHTPGHVSLLHEPSGVLVTGDAIWNVLRLSHGIPAFCTDVAMTRRTAAVLGDLEYTTAAFTHGPHVAARARERVRAFVRAAGG